MSLLVRWLLLKLVWAAVAPFAYLLAFFGVCWAIDFLDRIGVLAR